MNVNTSPSASTETLFNCGDVVSVLVPVAVPAPYDYLVGGQTVILGSIVCVPLGNRKVWGVVWGAGTQNLTQKRLKAIIAVSPAPPLGVVTRQFIDWVAAYTLSAPGLVMKMTIPVSEALQPQKPLSVVRPALNPPSDLRLTPSRQRVLDTVARIPSLGIMELAREAGVGDGMVRQMIQLGLLVTEAIPHAAKFYPPDLYGQAPLLSAQQAQAARALSATLTQGFSVTLLDGVTGSGKTEVYFEAIVGALKRGSQVLVLLPEIALSSQWLARFEARFGVLPAVWHSDLTPAQRRDTWLRIAQGEAKVVVGARSALFLPFDHLGLVVVDEEHDSGFKQEDGVCYNARDMAIVRAKAAGIPIILASATPSLETLVNVEAGKYQVQHLPNRHGLAQLPRIDIIDLRTTPPPRGRWLAPALIDAMTRVLDQGEQVMLFLNRRGYAPLTLCRSCGHRLQCPDCSAWLVEHRARQRLVCHHCGYWVAPPSACPHCAETHSFTACGPGIERIAEEAALLFPHARLKVMASDTLVSPTQANELVQDMTDRNIDILIGTQIMAKGHHFPYLTLVGVVDADLGLEGGDLRAAERTWQMLSQVAGRAGRANHPGHVLLQTWQPTHPVITTLAAGDRDGFLATEQSARKDSTMPPFGRLIALIISGTKPEAVDNFCQALSRVAPHHKAVDIWGPVPAPLALLRGRHRRRFLLKSPRGFALQALVRDWLAQLRPPGDIRIQVDVDPYSFN